MTRTRAVEVDGRGDRGRDGGEGRHVGADAAGVQRGEGRRPQALRRRAQRGETLDAPPRTIRVDRFDPVDRRGDDVDFIAVVGGGTYVRVLAADVGASLGCGAHLTRLRRTAIGPFDVADAVAPDRVGTPEPVERAVAHLPRVVLEAEEARAAANGRVLAPAGIEGPYGVYGPDRAPDRRLADLGANARPEMVLAPPG